jgi:hypothetical protein
MTVVTPTHRDTELRRAVVASLIAAPSLTTRNIGVAITDGALTLSGYVTSTAQKAMANVAVRRVKGVGRVTDCLDVAVPAPQEPDLTRGARNFGRTLSLSSASFARGVAHHLGDRKLFS